MYLGVLLKTDKVKEMAQKASERNEADYIGVKDELGQDITEGLVESLEKEIKLHKERLTQTEDNLQNYKEQWDVANRKFEILLSEDNLQRIEPVLKAELSEEYNTLVKKEFGYKYRQEKFVAEQTLKRYENEIEAITSQVVDAEAELAKAQGDEE